MSVLFIRQPSETPNIQNIDDIRMVRYAYGNQNGYIKGYGAELSHTATGSTFLINSGIFVIQGAEVKIDANGWSESVSGVTNKRCYIIYGEVNLALQTAEIKSTYSHSMYPTIEASDDLTQSTDGTARVELYRFTATNGIISDVEKEIKGIDYSTEKIATVDANIRNDLGSGALKAKIADYASLNTSKGTIEQRLTNLGFKQGSCYIGGTATYLTRQGNYVIWKSEFSNNEGVSGQIAQLPVNFRPLTHIKIWIGGLVNGAVSGINLEINSSGEVTIPNGHVLMLGFWQIGFEAPPIE